MMLLIDNIEAIYSDVILALTEVSMRVEDGSIVVLLGSNGAGKSTLLKSVSGVLSMEDGKLNEGKIELDGKRIDKLNPEDIAKLGICHVLQEHPVFQQLSAEENLLMGAYLRRDRSNIKKDLDGVYEYFSRLAALRNQKSGYLSGGEQQMLVIGRAFMARPKIMLLDEPSLGLAPKLAVEIFEVIKRINQEQKTSLLIAEQNAMAALSIADYGYVLENGKVILDGTAQTLKGHQRIRQSYLGLGTAKQYYEIKSSKVREQKEQQLPSC